jgi:chromosome segregation ATPase
VTRIQVISLTRHISAVPYQSIRDKLDDTKAELKQANNEKEVMESDIEKKRQQLNDARKTIEKLSMCFINKIDYIQRNNRFITVDDQVFYQSILFSRINI